MHYVLIGLSAIALLALPTNGLSTPSASIQKHIRQLQQQPPAVENGYFRISIQTADGWQPVGQLAFNKFFETRGLDLPGSNNDIVHVRIEQHGGGLAHLDTIQLGDAVPTNVHGMSDFEQGKMGAQNLDVVDVSRRTVEFEFDNAGETTLQLHARVEPETISPYPFIYPIAGDIGHTQDVEAFYSYRLDSAREALNVDGELAEVAGRKPFFSEFWPTGSGHPDGTTYGWISNDDQHLYVAIDFTADNTMDGDKDYAAVVVNTDNGPREFRVSVPDQTWGKPGFTYTDRVGYQHKVYEFKIPLAALGVKSMQPARQIQVALKAYGTATPSGFQESDIAYNSQDNEFMAVFEYAIPLTDQFGSHANIGGQRYDGEGNPIGAPFMIASTSVGIGDAYEPAVAYNSVDNVYVVVWRSVLANGDLALMFRSLNADGSLMLVSGSNDITPGVIDRNNTNSYYYNPDIAYSPNSNVFGVAYSLNNFSDHIYGTILNGNGLTVSTDIPIFLGSTDYPTDDPAIAHDSEEDLFVIAIPSLWLGQNDLYFSQLFPDGSAPQTLTAISMAPSAQENVDLVYDNVRKRFVAAFSDVRNGDSDIYMQAFASTGQTYLSPVTVNIAAIQTPYEDLRQYCCERRPGLGYDPINDEIVITAINEHFGNGQEYVKQRFDAATLMPLAVTIGANEHIGSPSQQDSVGYPAAAANTQCGGLLAQFTSVTSGTYEFVTLDTIGVDIDCTVPMLPPTIHVEAGFGSESTTESNFGSVTVGTSATSVVIVQNIGGGALNIGSVANNIPLSEPFSVASDSCSSETLAAGGTCTLVLAFEPTTTGEFDDQFDIPSDDTDNLIFTWDVAGTGVAVGNRPPNEPELKFPDDGDDVKAPNSEFFWVDNGDPDGDVVTYEFVYCTVTTFEGCEPILIESPLEVAANKAGGHGLPWGLGLGAMAVGFVVAPRRRRLLIAACFVLGATAWGCEGSGSFQLSLGEGQKLFGTTVNDLEAGNTYYWKVTAIDPSGERTESTVWTFDAI